MKTTRLDRTLDVRESNPRLNRRETEQVPESYLDRRGAERAPMECPVSFTSEERLDPRENMEGTLRDLSKTGCQIFSLQPPSRGSQITVVLFLPDGEPPMRLIGTAVRYVQGRVFGAEFLVLTPDERRRLQTIVFKHVTWSVFSLRRPAFRIADQ